MIFGSIIVSPKRLDRVCCFWPWAWNWNLFVLKYQSTAFPAKPFKAASPFLLSCKVCQQQIFRSYFSYIPRWTIFLPHNSNLSPYHHYVAKLLKHQSFKASHFFIAKLATSRYSGHTAPFDSLESQHLIFTVKPNFIFLIDQLLHLLQNALSIEFSPWAPIFKALPS